MSTVAEDRPELSTLSKKVFRYDAVVAILLALIVPTFLVVLFLSSAWASSRVWSVAPNEVAVDVITIAPSSRSEGPEGLAGDNPEQGDGATMEAPSVDATPGTDEPAPDQNNAIADTVNAVIGPDAEQSFDVTDPNRQKGTGRGGKSGGGGGEGRRGSGGGGGGGAIPPTERWSVVFNSTQTLDDYAKQMDFFGIELGVLHKNEQMKYINQLANKKPAVRQGGAGEQRLYFAWQDAGRRNADLALLKKANINGENGLVVHFYPPALEDSLASLERRYKNRKPEEIRLTKFGIRKAGGGFEFHVLSQSYTK